MKYTSLYQGRHIIHIAEFWYVYWKILYWDEYKIKKWLIICTYNPNKTLISNHLKEIGKKLDNYSWKYENFILLGNLNTEPTESAVRDFCEIYSCKNLFKDNYCFKNPLKPYFIDLIKTNRPKYFPGSVTIETGWSDFHKIMLAVMKLFCFSIKHKLSLCLMLKILLFKWLLKTTILSFIIYKAALDEAIQGQGLIKSTFHE